MKSKPKVERVMRDLSESCCTQSCKQQCNAGNWNLVLITYQGLQLKLNDGFGKDFTTVAYILVFSKVSVLCITKSTFILIVSIYE